MKIVHGRTDQVALQRLSLRKGLAISLLLNICKPVGKKHEATKCNVGTGGVSCHDVSSMNYGDRFHLNIIGLEIPSMNEFKDYCMHFNISC